MPDTLTFTTDVTVDAEDAVDAILGNPAAVTALFDKLDQKDFDDAHLEGLIRAASIEEILTPLVFDAFNVENRISHEQATALLAQHLPETIKLDRDALHEVVYDGHPQIRLALEMLLHWCDWVGGVRSNAFEVAYGRLRERTTEWIFENWSPGPLGEK